MSNNVHLFQSVLPTSGATTVTRTAPPPVPPVPVASALPASQAGLEISVNKVVQGTVMEGV